MRADSLFDAGAVVYGAGQKDVYKRQEQEFSSSVQANKMLFQKHLHDIQADFMNRLLETNFQTDALEEEALRLNIHLCGPQYQMVLFHCNSEQYWNILTYLEQFSQRFHPCIWSTRHGSLHAILLNVKEDVYKRQDL